MPPKKRQVEAESDKPRPKKFKPATQSAANGGLVKGTDSEGNTYWEIGHNRRVGVSKFKGTTLINIREYFTAPDGEMRPGKKGISLTLDQYKALLGAIPELNDELRSQGHAVDDPSAGETSGNAVKSEKKPKKSNIEATSEEEDDGDDGVKEEDEEAD